MAKTKTTGQGKKQCPECGEVVGVRTKECPKCKHQFEIKTASKSKAKSNGVDLEKEALRFAFLSAGGIDKAIKEVQSFQENEVSAFITKCGGAVEAIAQLNK